MGAVPVPPAVSGACTTRVNPGGVRQHRQPPSHRAMTEFVCGWSAGMAGARRRRRCVLRVIVAVAGRAMVRWPCRDHRRAGPQIIVADQAALADQMLQRAEPACVVAPAVVPGMAGLPHADLDDQALPEILPVDLAGLVQGERETERLALPGRRERELAVVPGRCRRARRIQEVGGVRVAARAGPRGLTLATPA